MCLGANDKSVYGKSKVRHFSLCSRTSRSLSSQSGGIVTVKTKQAVLVAEYDAPVSPGDATKIVEDLADWMIDAGF